MMSPQTIVHVGDASTVDLGESSAHLVVTSPPYWSIVDYGHQDQIGFGQSYEEYLRSMDVVLSRCVGALHPGCRMAIDIGDQYLRASEHQRYRVLPIPSDLISIVMRAGCDYMGGIIWRKISTTKTTGGSAWMGSTYWPRDGQITYEHEHILIFKKPGKAPKPSAEAKDRSTLTKEQRSRWFRGVWDDVRPTTKADHPAAFPIEIPDRLIRMYSFWGETVLDPFLGSGTTAASANAAGRDCVGVELVEDFLPTIERRVADVGGTVVRTSALRVGPD